MPTPPQGYMLDGKRLPSVTTIISRFKESGGLIHWAWDLGKQGLDYRDVRDAAASAGMSAHSLVEQHIHGNDNPAVPPGTDEKTKALAENAFLSYLEWAKQTHLKPVATELRIISKRHRFGGTLDALMVQDRLCLVDFKTSNSVYGDHIIQLAAYKMLWEEVQPDKPLNGAYICRFSKEKGDFATHYFSDLEDEGKAFLLMRELYDLVGAIKKRAG